MPPKFGQKTSLSKSNLTRPVAATTMANRLSLNKAEAAQAAGSHASVGSIPASASAAIAAAATPPVLSTTSSQEGIARGLRRVGSQESMGLGAPSGIPRKVSSATTQSGGPSGGLTRSMSRMATIGERKPTNPTKKQWSQLKLDLDDLKKKWEVYDQDNGGITPHTFKSFCRDNGIEFTVMILNVLMSDGRGSFGELLSSLVVDPTDPVTKTLNWGDLYTEFLGLDQNRDGVIDGTEFDRFTVQCTVAQKQIDEGMPALTFSDFVEYKITGKLKNVKGLDGLKRKFDDFVKLNKGRNYATGMRLAVAPMNSPARELTNRAQDDCAADDREQPQTQPAAAAAKKSDDQDGGSVNVAADDTETPPAVAQSDNYAESYDDGTDPNFVKDVSGEKNQQAYGTDRSAVPDDD